MGLLDVLEFAFKCVNFLAWPLFSLGYPLYASIRAIESDSKSSMRNLVAYWILFSLISFFELAFGKLLEWLPIWYYIKLVTICFLVLPQFDGACYAYEQLVRPCLSFNLEVIVKKFTNPKKDTSLNAETFLAVAEKYAKENGLEELEKLIAQKSNDAKPNADIEVIKAVTDTEGKETAGEIRPQLKEHIAARKHAEELEPTVKNPAAETKLPKCEEPNLAKENAAAAAAAAKELKVNNTAATSQERVKRVELNVAETGPKTAAAVEKIKQEKVEAEDKGKKVQRVEPNVAETSHNAVAAEEIKQVPVGVQDNAREVPTSDKVQKEWACALCLVTTSSEINLISHLEGRKHKARCQEMIASKQGPKNKDPSSTPNQEPRKANPGDNASKNKTKNEEEKLEQIKKQEQKAQEPKKSNSGCTANQNKTKKQENVEANRTYEQGKKKGNTRFFCTTCNIPCPSYEHFVSHVFGKKHAAQVQAKLNPQG
ncbi:hypothetical protein NMG60_11021375 [Bertholletia excelsa]